MEKTSLDTTWKAICAQLRADVTEFTFHIWFEPLEPRAVDGGTLFVSAPETILTWVRKRYVPRLRAAARTQGIADVEIVDRAWQRRSDGAADSPQPRPAGGGEDRLNPRYTFEQFVIGDANRFAHAAALAVAELPAQAYNPLFIHGPPGLGKTHLLHAIGNYVRRFGSGLCVRYTTAETFMTEFVAALRGTGDLQHFKRRFRDVDVLLVDDVQFLASKERTKEEFFHTFNALHGAGSQLVLTSDRPPTELPGLEDRLRERFACGLVAEVGTPDIDVRLAILRQRARQDGLDGVADETLRVIAEGVAGSVRSLEASLIRAVAYASLQGRELSSDLARQVLGRLGPKPSPQITIEQIQDETAAAFGLDRTQLLARDRRPEVALARKIAMYLAREMTQESLPAVGESFGGRNHTTVLHAHRRIADEVQRDPLTAGKVERIRRHITGADRAD